MYQKKHQYVTYVGTVAMMTIMLMVGMQAMAMTVFETSKTCPFCTTEFKAKFAASGTQFGMRLDLKPIGPIAAPWPVAVCPKCHYVLLNDELESGLSDSNQEKLKAFVQTKEYQAWGKKRSSHFLMGKLLSVLGRDDLTLAHVYLQASWQEEKEKEFLKEDLQLSLKHLEAFLKAAQNDKKKLDEEHDDAESPYQTARLLKGELLRRLARFDEAKAHLKALRKEKPFRKTFLGDIVKYEIQLCNKKDAEPHEIPDTDR